MMEELLLQAFDPPGVGFESKVCAIVAALLQ